MSDHRRVEPDAEILPARVAERVLRRASELDAVRKSGTVVAELRAAATEAGISADAFDAALGELHEADQVPAPVSARSTRRWRSLFIGLAGVGAIVIILAMVVIPARLVARAPVTTVEHVVQLKCVPADKALEQIGPLLNNAATSVVRPGKTSNTLIIRTTPEQLKNVQAAIDQVDNAPACVRR